MKQVVETREFMMSMCDLPSKAKSSFQLAAAATDAKRLPGFQAHRPAPCASRNRHCKATTLQHLAG
jgi:hypothetical protein